jgi:hypothetical protein
MGKDGLLPAQTLTTTQTTTGIENRVVKWGSLFGVMALTSNQPYFSTVIATGMARSQSTRWCLELRRVCGDVQH